jgi:hypothetical protein
MRSDRCDHPERILSFFAGKVLDTSTFPAKKPWGRMVA